MRIHRYMAAFALDGGPENRVRLAGGAPRRSSYIGGWAKGGTANMVLIGSGAQRERGDYYLTRFACCPIAMNADPRKPEVGFATTYFATQTRRQEVLERQLTEAVKRVEIRLRVMAANRRLAGAAKKAGVVRYPFFQAAGHRGLHGMDLAEVKARKGLSPTAELLDHAGPPELSAHEVKANLTEHRPNRDRVKTTA